MGSCFVAHHANPDIDDSSMPFIQGVFAFISLIIKANRELILQSAMHLA